VPGGHGGGGEKRIKIPRTKMPGIVQGGKEPHQQEPPFKGEVPMAWVGREAQTNAHCNLTRFIEREGGRDRNAELNNAAYTKSTKNPVRNKKIASANRDRCVI